MALLSSSRSQDVPPPGMQAGAAALVPATLRVLLLSVALNAAGQLLFKLARLVQPDGSMLALAGSPATWIGFFFYGLSSLCWLWVLARVPLSLAYPFLALTFPIVVALSAYFFGESISLLHWAGVGVIVVGVSLLART